MNTDFMLFITWALIIAVSAIGIFMLAVIWIKLLEIVIWLFDNIRIKKG